VTVVTIAACNSNISWLKKGQISSATMLIDKSEIATAPVETKVANHAFGQVEIPVHPQRVIVLDESMLLDSALALGIKPVGFAPCSNCLESHSGIPSELVADISSVGDMNQPSLEKILYLKPDLILSYEWQRQIYPQLSAIAPTVAIEPASGVGFKKEIAYIAHVLGRSDRVEEVLAKYEDRIKQLRHHLQTKLGTKKVATVHLYGSQISVWKPDLNTYSQIMSDAGLQFIQAQKDQQEDWLNISIEFLPKYDADFLFIVIVYEKDSENLNSLSFLKQPLWSTLKAAQNKQIYAVQWAGIGGSIGANRVIDDLYKYLVKAS
ncbi:iron-siderophore ABC transporter substrate-binding protein, partial [Chroococcidiopsidales cyanobacterium LEGE 13417]|nr:iron-siderophore ABC transporter substrate-binding protein [Chroococcidiopsidales cyanobacterium LEGE 13417]